MVTTADDKKIYGYTNYSFAVNYLNPHTILCNDIVKVDESINENCRFSTYDEEEDTYTEIYQYFLTALSEGDVEWLEDKFGLLFSYSDKLDLYVLCVDHCGTSWQSVSCPVYDEDIWNRVKAENQVYSDVN